jgi:hypothetical protein
VRRSGNLNRLWRQPLRKDPRPHSPVLSRCSTGMRTNVAGKRDRDSSVSGSVELGNSLAFSAITSVIAFSLSSDKHILSSLLEARLIARRTLSQFASTHATARQQISSRAVAGRGFRKPPSVPSFNVAILLSRACICMASVPLKSRNCRRFSSSAFLAAIRVVNTDEGWEGWRSPDPGSMVGRDE